MVCVDLVGNPEDRFSRDAAKFKINFMTFSQSMTYPNTPIPLDGVSATFRNFGQNDTKRGRNAKSAAETP